MVPPRRWNFTGINIGKVSANGIQRSISTGTFHGFLVNIHLCHMGLINISMNNRKFLSEIVSFPQKSIEEPQEYCSICYIYRLNNQIPMITCDNTKCYLAYHTLCLKEWFSSIRDSKTFLNVTSGQCPSCKEVFIYIVYLTSLATISVLTYKLFIYFRNYRRRSCN